LIYFDIETRTWAHEHPNEWDDIPHFGMALAVTWDADNGYRTWYSGSDLASELLSHDRIISFNGYRFDNVVLSHDAAPEVNGLSEEVLRAELDARTFDLLADLKARLGHRVALQQLAEALGQSKTGSGDQAPLWWKSYRHLSDVADRLRDHDDPEGAERVQEAASWFLRRIESYCRRDVEITRMVHEVGRERGKVEWLYHGERQSVEVDWT